MPALKHLASWTTVTTVTTVQDASSSSAGSDSGGLYVIINYE